MRVSARIRWWVSHPVTQLVIGGILFLSGFSEAYLSLSQDLSGFRLGAHHGLLVFGLYNMVAAVPDILQGVGSGAAYLEHLERQRRDELAKRN